MTGGCVFTGVLSDYTCGRGTPFHVRTGKGNPIPRSGWGCTPSQVWTGIPHLRSGRGDTLGYPSIQFPGQDGGGYPRVPSPLQDWLGYPPPLGPNGVPPSRTGWGIPHPDLDWPPPPHQETEQHSEHLLHGRQYASCVNAGGLSCLVFKFVKLFEIKCTCVNMEINTCAKKLISSPLALHDSKIT